MIKSMTGYGGARGPVGELDITVEIRSVNNRFFDCSVRIPRVYTALEESIKARVQSKAARGKIDVFVTIDTARANNVSIEVSEPVADAYYAALQKISERFGIPNDATASTIARMPDVLVVTKTETDVEELKTGLLALVDQALEDFDAMRIAEGRRLSEDLKTRLNEVERLVGLAEERSPVTVAEYRERLTKRLTEVLESTKLDEARILTEAAIFADRVDVNEEIVRLRSHLCEFHSLVGSQVPVGRKLDFLMQEFNREANTLGSKGNDLAMARIVVDLKSEIEKLREQVQNVE